MENNLSNQQTVAFDEMFITQDALLDHWQGHRRLTRRVIEAFPEDKLFSYSVGGMRPFAVMVNEMIGLAGAGLRGIVTGEWASITELYHHSGNSDAGTKEEILQQWDKLTGTLDSLWPLIVPGRLQEKVLAFGQWEGYAYDMVLYWIDNEVHHRAQGYVYLRSLGIEPPPFWDRA